MAKKKDDLPQWVKTGRASDARPQKENAEAEAETPQEEVEIRPPPVAEDVRRENERQNIPWTPDGVSVEEHRKQIEVTAAKPMPLSEGNAPLDRSIVPPVDPPVPAPLDPQAEQAMRLQEIWGRAQALNPEGMPISAVQLSDTVAEVTTEDGIETTTIRLGQNYVAGPDANEQPHGTVSKSGELPKIPCPHCEGTGEVPFGWVHKDNGDAA